MSVPTLSIKADGLEILNIPIELLLWQLSGYTAIPRPGTVLDITLTDGPNVLTVKQTVIPSDDPDDD